ncbi:hypothetical protein [Polymorphobacter fuscus]|uniref:Uncharacterized protein n=1 Tax=Sandarakinorhabdus fusca TaxID=1439888 RepID=A0A7C9GQ63_9SPHN|nr:hypothetical protein [Polymorphobacter fuscus]KAB7644806.1 hypothetical protein F9290_12500 [Polymorphobacter fuscus]MQT18077.1 hypothetical protein [Polymorphobacter fuscus]NJC09394.1 hypothetical protein [Polymorphobacter fuscus]
MKTTLRFIGVAAVLAIATSAGAQNTVKAGAQTNTDEKSDLDKVGDTMENIGTRPLKDLNIIKAKVAPEIEAIMQEPYSLKGIRSCAQFKTAINRMTAVLGPDVDSPQTQKDDKTPAEVALSLGESAAGGIIPFSGVIRRLTGAEARQKYAQAAIYAGSVRRAYLKGTARAKGCKV